jgi:peptidoglycan hydrolase-like protein with peptidoglycan-binding domain
VTRRIVIPVAAVALATAAGGAAWAVAGQGSSSSAATTSETLGAGATATVERRDLVQHETVDGTLGYDDAEALYAPAMGTVTALREPGTVVRRGQALYWLNGKPVTLMYGAMPMHRPLDASSDDGNDIRELERNLVELGYDPDGDVEIDREWDWATTAAVKRWQEDTGLEETGAVELGQIVFLPGPRRIGELQATVGAPLQPGSEVLETTSTTRVVTIDLDATQQSLVSEGDPVIVELPDGRTIDGTITSVGQVAESETDPQTGEQGDPTIPVEVRLARGAKTGSLDQAPVDVSLQKDRVEDAFTVPVGALLALAEGGYAVEVVEPGGSTHLVRVEPGMYADGMVEITGKGIDDGTKVVIPG